MKKATRRLCCVIIAIIMTLAGALAVFAEQESFEKKYCLGKAVNTGKDNGYSGLEAIDEDDPHYGWELGEFFITGYTEKADDPNGNPVFLKNVGDKAALWFNLQQNIFCLNGNEKLTISEDKNGYDKYFEVEKTNFGHGTLIIRFTDYQNHIHEPVIYTDYLSALIQGANTKVELFEEGDYEVSLDYEIKKNTPIIPGYTNYRIFFKFSVRNGNCMVFPFDVKTGAELTNTAITENGFYLDLANSRYLTINIRKEILTEGADGLTEDTRFNRPAKDHDPFTDEGIYTITVTNKYTNQQTVKVIYVGSNSILKAYAVTGLPITEIKCQLASGASIAADGTIIPPANTPPPEENDPVSNPTDANKPVPDAPEDGKQPSHIPTGWLIGIIAAAAVIVIIIIVTAALKKRKPKKEEASEPDKGEGDRK